MPDAATLEQRLEAEARRLGFAAVGFARVGASTTQENYRHWLAQGYAGTMAWLHRHADLKADPRTLLPEARTIIVVAARYESRDNGGGISMYAQARDYHLTLCEKLRQLEKLLKEEGSRATRICVDSAPVAEREWAVRSGIGWIGKNSNVISEKAGCSLLLAEILTDLELGGGTIETHDRCGSCNACVEACPTAAILPGREVDARRCISYLTIEHKGEFVPDERQAVGQWLFGCDICTAVCPWNRHGENQIMSELKGARQPAAEAILAMDEAAFRREFRDTPLERTGLLNLQRNARAVLDNQLRRRIRPT